MTWPTKKLGEIAEIYQGGRNGLTKKDYVKSGFPAFSATGQDGFTKKAFDSGSAIILSSIGARCGKCFYTEGKWTALANTQVIKLNNPTTAKFLYYYLNDEKRWPRYGSAQPFIAPSTVKRLKVPFPSLKIQQKIVERLDAIKKAQELNDKQIELAEELFQSLLHCELNPKGKNWEIKKLGELCDCKDGDWILTKDLQTGNDVRLIQLGDIGEINFLDKTCKYISKERCQELGCTLLKPNDILLNRMGDPIGIACILPHLSYPAITAVDVTIIRSKKEMGNQFFILYSLNSKPIRRQIEAFATGSTRRRISRKNLEKIKIPLPPLETQREIVEKLSAVQEYKKKLIEQKSKLKELFESVLNKSMIGKLVK
jgi:restriction endonuclease S subunit